MKDLIIFGAGGHGREIHQLVVDINAASNSNSEQWNLLGFLDGDQKKHGTRLRDLPVLGGEAWLQSAPNCHVVVAMGNTVVKRRVVNRLLNLGVKRFASLIHPRASVGDYVTIGEGTTISAGAIITTDISIGAHVTVNIGASISHDCCIADYTTIAPRVCLCGNVAIAEGADLGAGSTVIQGLSIGEWAVIGAGAVVLKDVPANATAVGSPACVIKQKQTGWHNTNE